MSKMKQLLKIHEKIKRADKLLAIETLLWLFTARLMVTFLPFKVIKPHLGEHMKNSDAETDKNNLRQIKRVRSYILKIGKIAPWKCTCYVDAITAKQLLKRRQIQTTIYFGVGKDDKKKLIAHAWLQCGHTIITGGDCRHNYKEVSFFT